MSKKRYIITSITLGLIAAGSGALIGLTHLVTKDKIAQNEKDRINAGISEIFGNSASILSENEISGYKYTNYLYHVNETSLAFRTEGSNSYGKVSLLVGFNYVGEEDEGEYKFAGLYVVVNEQTYASTLVANYLEPVNGGTRDIEDVSCGATYGAKLVRDMVNEAKEVADKL